MWWAALIPVAMELMKGMSENGKKQQGGAAPMQFQAPAAFNPAPMTAGGAPDPAMTARALGGQAPGIMSQPPDFGDFDSDRMAEILRRGESIYR